MVSQPQSNGGKIATMGGIHQMGNVINKKKKQIKVDINA
jgi:hypothetical protein